MFYFICFWLTKCKYYWPPAPVDAILDAKATTHWPTCGVRRLLKCVIGHILYLYGVIKDALGLVRHTWRLRGIVPVPCMHRRHY